MFIWKNLKVGKISLINFLFLFKHESEILPFPNSEKNFILPEEIIQEVKEGEAFGWTIHFLQTKYYSKSLYRIAAKPLHWRIYWYGLQTDSIRHEVVLILQP